MVLGGVGLRLGGLVELAEILRGRGLEIIEAAFAAEADEAVGFAFLPIYAVNGLAHAAAELLVGDKTDLERIGFTRLGEPGSVVLGWSDQAGGGRVRALGVIFTSWAKATEPAAGRRRGRGVVWEFVVDFHGEKVAEVTVADWSISGGRFSR